MKLNLHKKKLTLFVFIGDSDGFRKINLYEDFDETFLNYNFKNTLKPIEYVGEPFNLEGLKKYKKNTYKNFLEYKLCS